MPFAPGFIEGDLANLAAARLKGSRCRDCGVVLLGSRARCENCSSKSLDREICSATGIVYTFTIQRYAPPLPFRASFPWRPRPIAWVDLDESGPRILAPIACAPEVIKIGARVELFFEVGWVEESSEEVIIFGFRPCAHARATPA